MFIASKQLKLRISYLTHVFSGTVRTWSLKFTENGVARVTWPPNFWALNAYSYKMVKATKFKFHVHVSIGTFRTSIKIFFIKGASLGLLTSALYYLLFLYLLTKFCKIVYVLICTLDRMKNLPGRYMPCKGVESCQDLDFLNCQFVDIHIFRHHSFIFIVYLCHNCQCQSRIFSVGKTT